MAQTTTGSNQNGDYQNIVNRKFDLATAGLPFIIIKYVIQNVSPENTLTIVKYILAMKVETNISDAYRSYTIQTVEI
jgi:hypothetical protein